MSIKIKVAPKQSADPQHKTLGLKVIKRQLTVLLIIIDKVKVNNFLKGEFYLSAAEISDPQTLNSKLQEKSHKETKRNTLFPVYNFKIKSSTDY